LRGLEQVPRTGGLIVASNHISFWDPPLVGAALPREAHYLAKEELFSNPVVGRLIGSLNAIPIRRGMVDLQGLTRAIETLRRGEALILFPEGSRMRDGQLHPARPGVSIMAHAAGVPIVPCYISGSDRPRRWLPRRTRVRIWFGPARRWQDLAGQQSDLPPSREFHRRVGDAVMREIAALRDAQSKSAVRGAV
jgi:1-acyl-sn-glycerol-3-phosphate acyltransferase